MNYDYTDYIYKRIDFEQNAYEDKLQVLSEQTIKDIAKKAYDAKIKAGEAKQKYNTESKNYDTWKEEAWKTVENANTEPEITTATEEVVPENTTTIIPAIINTILNTSIITTSYALSFPSNLSNLLTLAILL